MIEFQQPHRNEKDGKISVQRVGEEIHVGVVHDGVDQVLILGGFNAYRVLAALALVLKVTLSKAVQRAIKM